MSMALEMTKVCWDAKKFGYRQVDESTLETGMGGLDNKGDIKLIVFFDDDDKCVALRSFDYCKFNPDKKAKMYEVCSKMNNLYRWVKFFVDENDCTITLADDAVVDFESCGEELFELTLRMVSIGDEAYPEFMKALWA